MKKFVLMAFVAMLLVACGYKSVEFPVGKDYVKYTAKIDDKIVVGLKTVETQHVLIAPEIGYTDIQLKIGQFFIAHKEGLWKIYDLKGNPCLKGELFPLVRVGSNYLLLKTKDEKQYFLCANGSFGPCQSLDLRLPEGVAFYVANNAPAYGLADLKTCKSVVQDLFQQIVVATASDGKVGYYVLDGNGWKSYDPSTDIYTPLKDKVFKALQKEAQNNKTPWPQEGCGFVKVKALR